MSSSKNVPVVVRRKVVLSSISVCHDILALIMINSGCLKGEHKKRMWGVVLLHSPHLSANICEQEAASHLIVLHGPILHGFI